MKKLVLMLTMICALTTVKAQKANDGLLHTENFIIDGADIGWQKTYYNKRSFKEVVLNIKMEGLLDNADVDEPVITGEMKPIANDYKGAGYKWGNTNVAQGNAGVMGFVAIMQKGDSATVQIRRIAIANPPTGGLFKHGEKIGAIWINKKGELHPGLFAGKVAHVYDFTFDKMFSKLFN